MRRYIVISRPRWSVYYDELASSPLEVVNAGDLAIAERLYEYEPVQGKGEALWDVLIAPDGFKSDVGANDTNFVYAQCELVARYKMVDSDD
jgi:hypothetical protein